MDQWASFNFTPQFTSISQFGFSFQRKLECFLPDRQWRKKKKKLLRSLRQKSKGEVLLSCIQKSKHRAQGQKKREAVIILSFHETLMSFSGCLVLGFILFFLMSGQHPFTTHRQHFVRHITPDGYLEIEGK